jgi:hypothetical protein
MTIVQFNCACGYGISHNCPVIKELKDDKGLVRKLREILPYDYTGGTTVDICKLYQLHNVLWHLEDEE